MRVLFGEEGEKVSLDAPAIWFSSEIVEVETARVLDRARLLGRLNDRETASRIAALTALLRTGQLVPLSREIVALARATFPVPVRALDALHVATAEWLQRELGEPMEFWTHDRIQGAAALCRSLDVRGVAL